MEKSLFPRYWQRDDKIGIGPLQFLELQDKKSSEVSGEALAPFLELVKDAGSGADRFKAGGCASKRMRTLSTGVAHPLGLIDLAEALIAASYWVDEGQLFGTAIAELPP